MISKDNYTEKYAFLFERAYYRLAQKTPMYRKMNLVYLNENKTTFLNANFLFYGVINIWTKYNKREST